MSIFLPHPSLSLLLTVSTRLNLLIRPLRFSSCDSHRRMRVYRQRRPSIGTGWKLVGARVGRALIGRRSTHNITRCIIRLSATHPPTRPPLFFLGWQHFPPVIDSPSYSPVYPDDQSFAFIQYISTLTMLSSWEIATLSDTLTGLGGGCHGFQHGVPKKVLFKAIQLFEGCDSHAVTNAAVICHFTFLVYFHSFTRGLFGLLDNLKSIGDRIKND